MNRISKLFVATFLLLGGCVFIASWGHHAFKQFTMAEYYWGDINKFGQKDCSFQKSIWRDSDSFASVIKRPHSNMRATQVPWRGGKRPGLEKNEYVFVECGVDLSSLDQNGFAWINLGRIYGDSAVYLNGNLRTLVGDTGQAEFFVHPEDRRMDSVVTFISRRFSGLASAGLLTPVSPVFSSQREQLDRLQQAYTDTFVETPVFRLGYSLALFAIFAVSWILGFRYADIGWMVVVTAAIVIQSASFYSPVAYLAEWQRTIYSTMGNFIHLALAAFLLAFFRVIKNQTYVVAGVVGILVAYRALVSFSSPALNLLISNASLGWWMGAAMYFGCVVVGFRNYKKLEGKRRSRVKWLTSASGFGVVLYLMQIFTYSSHMIRFDIFLSFILITIFSLFLLADMVLFQQEFFQEKSHKLKERHEKSVLQERMKLGRVVRKLLIPQDESILVNDVSIEFRHQSANELSGDWYYTWEVSDTEYRLIFGDVGGKGQGAALVVTAILASLEESKRHKASMNDAIESVNETLLNLFEGYMTSTLSAVVVGEDCNLEFWNCGGLGWFACSDDKVDSYCQRASLLGMGKNINVKREKLRIEDGMRVLSFTDGVIGEQNSIVDSLRSLTASTNGDQSIDQIYRGLTKSKPDQDQEGSIEDDRTLLMIKKIQQQSTADKAV